MNVLIVLAFFKMRNAITKNVLCEIIEVDREK